MYNKKYSSVQEALAKADAEGKELPGTAEEQSLRKMGKKVMAMNKNKRRGSNVFNNVKEALKGLNISDKTMGRLHMPSTENFTSVHDILEMIAAATTK